MIVVVETRLQVLAILLAVNKEMDSKSLVHHEAGIE